eukprot:7701219-Alexandrium_andersonii.AAC.1
MPSPLARYTNHYEGKPFPENAAVDRVLAGGIIPDQDPNRQTAYEAVLTARLSYVGKVIQANCTF